MSVWGWIKTTQETNENRKTTRNPPSAEEVVERFCAEQEVEAISGGSEGGVACVAAVTGNILRHAQNKDGCHLGDGKAQQTNFCFSLLRGTTKISVVLQQCGRVRLTVKPKPASTSQGRCVSCIKMVSAALSAEGVWNNEKAMKLPVERHGTQPSD